MDILPNEILNCIFKNLHLLQKQECMLVCHQWSTIIRSTSLFSTAYISKTFTLKKLAQILDDNPSYKSQIQSLIVDDSEFFTLSSQLVLTYFPSVHSIHIKDPIFSSWNAYDRMMDLNAWGDNIKALEHCYEFKLFRTLQLSKEYINLTKLVINNPFSTTNEVNILANAPNINDMTLITAEFSLQQLAVLNRNLKALNSLTLDKVSLQSDDDELNGTITAFSIETFFISFIFNHTTDTAAINWLQYITKNFPLLLQFRFVFPWTDSISLQKETSITNNGLIPFVQNIGNQLKCLDVSCSEGVIPVLETLNILQQDIQMLHLRTLLSFNRRSFIYLGELNILINQLTITLNSVNRIKECNFEDLKVLKKLKIGCITQTPNVYRTLCLNQLLDSCPNSLESLEIYDFQVWCQNKSLHSYSLKKLSIHSNMISRDIYQFISNCLPSLKYLTINQRDGTNTDSILLNGNNLHYLEVSMKGNHFILLNILSDNTSHYYRLDNYENSDFHSVELNRDQPHHIIRQTASDKILDSEKVIEVICSSVNTFIINKKLAF